MPVSSDPDIEARLTAKFDERFKGLQRVIAEKDEALKTRERELQEVRMSGMSQDEKDALEWETLQKENAELRQKAQLLELQSDYPDEMSYFKRILEGKSPKEQLDVLREMRKQQAQASVSQDPTAELETDVPDVDHNNPPAVREPVSSSSGDGFNGVPWTDELADRVLRSVKRMRS
jgi:hypothetical protein